MDQETPSTGRVSLVVAGVKLDNHANTCRIHTRESNGIECLLPQTLCLNDIVCREELPTEKPVGSKSMGIPGGECFHIIGSLGRDPCFQEILVVIVYLAAGYRSAQPLSVPIKKSLRE